MLLDIDATVLRELYYVDVRGTIRLRGTSYGMTWISYDICTVQPTTVASTGSHSGDQSI